jgi:hypothetical protein
MPKSKRSAKRRKKVKYDNKGKVVVKDVIVGHNISREVKDALKVIENPEADFDTRMKLRDKYFNQTEVKPEYLISKTKYS